ncbi:MAG: hypothetical protein AB1414_06185 [bacterium]
MFKEGLKKQLGWLIVFLILLISPAFAEAPGEVMFIKSNAPKIWQKAIGILFQYQGDTSLIVFSNPYGKSPVILESYSPEDTNICPLSVFGYLSGSMTETTRKFPLLAVKNGYAKIIYNVNSGVLGWVKIKGKDRGVILFSETTALNGTDIIYLGAITQKNSHFVKYFNKPNGKVIYVKKILPFFPEDVIRKNVGNFPGENFWGRNYYWIPADILNLGTLIKIVGDWAQIGDFNYNTYETIPKGWVRIRDNKGNLLIWFIDVDRC